MGESTGWVYIAADGDQVGRRIELALLRNDVRAAAELSSSVHRAIDALAKRLTHHGCEVLFLGGDNLLARRSGEPEESVSSFADHNVSFSIGYGRTPQEALIALCEAKLARGA